MNITQFYCLGGKGAIFFWRIRRKGAIKVAFGCRKTISEKGKCFPLFGCLGNRFPENQFLCLVRPNILRKSFYGKSITVFDSSKHFTENTLRKIISGV